MIYIEYSNQPITNLNLHITCWFASDKIPLPRHCLTLSVSALAFTVLDRMDTYIRSSMIAEWHKVYKLVYKEAVLRGLENGCDFYDADRIPKTLPIDIEVRERKLYGASK
jgi:hypothetical protein